MRKEDALKKLKKEREAVMLAQSNLSSAKQQELAPIIEAIDIASKRISECRNEKTVSKILDELHI